MSGERILDAGAGEMRFRKYCEHLIYVAQDFAQYDPSKIDMGLQMEKWDYSGLDIVCDIINIPEPNGSFDNIMCIEVIEHIPDPAKVFPEFSRLLKPGGKLILTGRHSVHLRILHLTIIQQASAGFIMRSTWPIMVRNNRTGGKWELF
ncbi:MAG: class I SAM-dependent methyltransferase [Ferruginibacter sp.]